MLPLFVITGASASGKSTVCRDLVGGLLEAVVLEGDILWRQEFNTPETDYSAFRNVWLRMAKNIGQNGRPVVLSGGGVPAQYENCPERRYFSEIHYLALVAEDAELERRLRGRPPWRESSDPRTIQTMLVFNNWLKNNADETVPPITLLDTTRQPVGETVWEVLKWVRERL
jgi:shikimate kinase